MNKLLIIMLLLLSNVLFGQMGGVYSEGFRFGKLTKTSLKGWINKSVESELNMGFNGGRWTKGSGEDEKIMNPWAFSAEKNEADTLHKYLNKYIVVEYVQSKLHNRVLYNTDYMMKSIRKVTKEYVLLSDDDPSAFWTAEPSYNYSKGSRTGKLAKVSKKGYANKTYEIVLQEGGDGNVYYEMSVESDAIYKKMIECLMSGKTYTFHYKQKYVSLSEDTSYVIYGITYEIEEKF